MTFFWSWVLKFVNCDASLALFPAFHNVFNVVIEISKLQI